MHGIEEMFGLHQRRDAVIDIVVGQNRAQKLLFRLDIMRKHVSFRNPARLRQHRPDRRQLAHKRLVAGGDPGADLLAGLNPGVRLVPSHVMAMGLVQERGVTYVRM